MGRSWQEVIIIIKGSFEGCHIITFMFDMPYMQDYFTGEALNDQLHIMAYSQMMDLWVAVNIVLPHVPCFTKCLFACYLALKKKSYQCLWGYSMYTNLLSTNIHTRQPAAKSWYQPTVTQVLHIMWVK